MKNVGLILEGGGQRGVFTGGVLDYLMEQSFEVPYVIGVSAGTCNAVDFVSKQPCRTKKCMIDAQKEHELYSAKNIWRKGYYIDMDLIFTDFPEKIYPFDFETFKRSKTRCLMTATDCISGEAVYIEEKEDKERMMAAVRASSSLPFAASEVMIDGRPMMDGGLRDSVPIQKATNDGYKYNIIILTRPTGYRKSEKHDASVRLAKAAYKKYPNLVRDMEHRAHRYNKTMDIIDELEAKGRVYVIRPEIACVKRTEKDIEKLEVFYKHGYDMMKEKYDDLTQWLTRADDIQLEDEDDNR